MFVAWGIYISFIIWVHFYKTCWEYVLQWILYFDIALTFEQLPSIWLRFLFSSSHYLKIIWSSPSLESVKANVDVAWSSPKNYFRSPKYFSLNQMSRKTLRFSTLHELLLKMTNHQHRKATLKNESVCLMKSVFSDLICTKPTSSRATKT